ncbi:hypothetical protein DFJ63DRAFT_211316 [Scheffersomyces coipomensis]|uniref:uncharacterized protein n=1 Tax=Scheffersomyces coipomensis TaxID=1788519 RepID=UPI00315DB85E
MSSSGKLPLGVRVTDVIHRVTVLGLVGIVVVGMGSITFNVWSNSDYAPWNKEKLKFVKEEYHEARSEGKDDK